MKGAALGAQVSRVQIPNNYLAWVKNVASAFVSVSLWLFSKRVDTLLGYELVVSKLWGFIATGNQLAFARRGMAGHELPMSFLRRAEANSPKPKKGLPKKAQKPL